MTFLHNVHTGKCFSVICYFINQKHCCQTFVYNCQIVSQIDNFVFLSVLNRIFLKLVISKGTNYGLMNIVNWKKTFNVSILFHLNNSSYPNSSYLEEKNYNIY